MKPKEHFTGELLCNLRVRKAFQHLETNMGKTIDKLYYLEQMKCLKQSQKTNANMERTFANYLTDRANTKSP